MWRSFVILFVVTTHLCILVYSYKITIDRSSKTIQAYDQQDSSNLPEDHAGENYSNGESSKQSSGRVVIGKWRNNGEALEPKWRDGDSVPLAPFSTMSFKSGWQKDPASRGEDYQNEPDSFDENGKKRLRVFLADQNSDATEPEENRENYPSEGEQRAGYKNAHRKDRQFNRPTAGNEKIGNSSSRIGSAVRKFSNTFKESLPRNNANENIQSSLKYRETLPNYPNEYELFENENDSPRPRKRRPPEHYEFPGSWGSDNKRRDESYADDQQGVIEQSQSLSMTSDVRQYVLSNQDPKSINRTKAQENTELKAFLKMQGANLSLSEILQQKNLTLADLLNRKTNAIKILKLNEKRLESVQEEDTFTEPAERTTPDSTSENPSWSTPRRIIIKELNNKSSFDGEMDSTVINFGKTSPNFETTTSPIVTSTSKKIKGIADPIPSFNTTDFIKDDETISSEKFEPIDPPDVEKRNSGSSEFLNPFENRESLVIEATSAVEDGAAAGADSFNGQQVGMSNGRFVQESNNDEDEIMEFSDYPATKMPRLVAPIMVHETATLNTKKKNIPFSAIRTTVKPVEDPELKLSIENILTPENKVATIINDTDKVDKDSRKIGNEIGVKRIGIMSAKDQYGVSERKRNETGEVKLPEKIDVNSKSKEYGNPAKNNENEKESGEKGGEKISAKDVKNDFSQNTKESNIRSYGYETLSQDKKNLALNHKFHEVVIPKVDPQSRAEILELFSSGSSAERLERLLASRNMTIEELIALRQRGSSQVHFAEVFKATEQTLTTSLPQSYKTDLQISFNYKENEKIQTSETTRQINPLRENNNSSDVEDERSFQSAKNTAGDKEKERLEKEAEYLATHLLNQLSVNKTLRKNITLDKRNRDPDAPAEISDIKSRRVMELEKSIGNSDLKTTMLEEFPADNNIQRDSQGSSNYTSIEVVRLPVEEEEEEEEEKKKSIPDIFEEAKIAVIKSASSEEIGRVEEILNNDLKSINKVYGINDYEFSEKKALSKVKPSIIASGGILGVTIVVFLSIFIACRIQQKKKFAYKNSFTKAVFHNPVMTARKLSNTSSVNTIMVDVVATSTTKRPQKHDTYERDNFEPKSDIDNDSLDANDSWDTIPDFMK